MRIGIRAGLVVLAIAAALVPVDPRLVERWFSTSVYPFIQRLLTPGSNVVPFALLDELLIVSALVVIVVLSRGVQQARRKKTLQPLLAALGRLLVWSAAGYLAFLMLWGLNYRRLPMSDRLVLEGPSPSAKAVIALGLDAAEHLNVLHESAHAAGWRTAPWRERSLRESYTSVVEELSDAPPAVPGRLKWSVFGPYFRWAGVDGMINPFGLEAIGNPDLLPFERPFVAAHEWAHLAGYADESEASFVGWLTCVRADAPAQYSGWLFLYWQVRSEVGSSGRKQLGAALDEGPRADVDAIAARLRSGEVPLLRDASWRAYDSYLKANRVEQGVRSYGAVVTLLVRAKFAEGWKPARKSAVGSGQ